MTTRHVRGRWGDKRDQVAIAALALCEAEKTKSAGLLAVEAAYDCANPTARNLVNRGRRLRDQAVAQVGQPS